MKYLILFSCFSLFLPSVLLSQYSDSNIHFTAQKGEETFCGKMTPISIIQGMTDPYDVVHSIVSIDDDIFATEQTFLKSDLVYNDLNFNSDYYEDRTWCGSQNDNFDCYQILFDSTSLLSIGNNTHEIYHYNAIGEINEQNSFTLQVIENIGIIPFAELSLNGYHNFQLTGLEVHGIYYPTTESQCFTSSEQNILHPEIERYISSQTTNATDLIQYSYNKNGAVIYIEHSDECDLTITGYIQDNKQLIISESKIFSLQINTDHFFENNIISGHYENENGEYFSFNIFENRGKYTALTIETTSSTMNSFPVSKYSNLVFNQGKVEINDILGNRSHFLTTNNQYTYGSKLQNNIYAFFENNKKTIHLYDLNLELLQDLQLLFPNIDGFKIINNNFITWKGDCLSYFSFIEGTAIDLDKNANINSIRIHGDEMTWKSLDQNHFKKLSIDSDSNILIENQPMFDDFDNPQFCYWNDSILVYVDKHTYNLENTELIEVSISQSANKDIQQYDIRLDSMKITLVDAITNEYRFDYTITNQGNIELKEINFSTTKLLNNECTYPLLDIPVSLNNLEADATYSGSFLFTTDQFESLCFYVSSPSGFSDSNFDDNYKCYTGNITSISNISTQSSLTYPNPVLDLLYIDDYNGQVEVYNNIGQQIMKQKIENSLNVSDLPPGIYFIKLDNLKTMKILKK